MSALRTGALALMLVGLGFSAGRCKEASGSRVPGTLPPDPAIRQPASTEVRAALREPSSVVEATSDAVETPATPRRPTLAENLADVDGTLQELPEYHGNDEGLRRKYAGLTPAELEHLYPLLRSIRKEEMFEALDAAIARGQQTIEIVPAGEPLDLFKYQTPGDTIQPVAQRATPLGSGMVEYSIVCFDRARFPEVWLRSYEETWVHDRLDEAGLCEEGDDRH